MKIWVDADACPSAVKDIIFKAMHKHQVDTYIVANKALWVPPAPYCFLCKFLWGDDQADHYITQHASQADLVITQDIPLAGILVPKGIVVISFHGTLFTPESIGERVSIRNFMQDLRSSGAITSGPKPFGPKDKQQFANTFDSQMTKLLKKLPPSNL